MEQGEAGNHGNDQGSSGAALHAGGDEDGARAFIAQVKEEVERCLAAGMSKEQMFHELREKGFHPAAAFAVYKELRDQNNSWFKDYYVKMDLRKQAERLEFLLHQYRTVRDADAAARAQGTAAQQTAMDIPNDVGFLGHRTVPAGLDGTRLVCSSSCSDRRLASASLQLPLSSTTMYVPTGQLLHQIEQPVPNGGVQGVLEPSAACTTSNAAMAVTYPWSCTDNVQTDDVGTMLLHGEQGPPLQQWYPGASAGVVPPWDSNWPTPSSVQMPPENREHHHRPAPCHGEQAEQRLLIDSLRLGEDRNPQVHVASRHGEQAHEPLHQWQSGSQPEAPSKHLLEYQNRHDLAASE
ncbi:uncharacterized protein [Triticum aestivum]|uniref:uncharacterized protein n=1 Tax=Triticum aestivum TaxID=4565 RepID=UPI00084317CE|nr:uncharacterized protein LOC123185872 [Triticum aestivum]